MYESKKELPAPFDVDSLAGLRKEMISLRDEALKQTDFQSAVMLSHVIKWMHWHIENDVVINCSYGVLMQMKTEIASLKETISVLEKLRPQWARGYSSDSVAAQCATDALVSIFEILNVKDQTSAMTKLREMMGIE